MWNRCAVSNLSTWVVNRDTQSDMKDEHLVVLVLLQHNTKRVLTFPITNFTRSRISWVRLRECLQKKRYASVWHWAEMWCCNTLCFLHHCTQSLEQSTQNFPSPPREESELEVDWHTLRSVARKQSTFNHSTNRYVSFFFVGAGKNKIKTSRSSCHSPMMCSHTVWQNIQMTIRKSAVTTHPWLQLVSFRYFINGAARFFGQSLLLPRGRFWFCMWVKGFTSMMTMSSPHLWRGCLSISLVSGTFTDRGYDPRIFSRNEWGRRK